MIHENCLLENDLLRLLRHIDIETTNIFISVKSAGLTDLGLHGHCPQTQLLTWKLVQLMVHKQLTSLTMTKLCRVTLKVNA